MVFNKDWFVISKLIFHFLEYYKLNYGATSIDRIKVDIKSMSLNKHSIDIAYDMVAKNDIIEALKILGIKRCKGVDALINNTYPIYFDHQKYLEKFHGLSDMKFILSGGPR